MFPLHVWHPVQGFHVHYLLHLLKRPYEVNILPYQKRHGEINCLESEETTQRSQTITNFQQLYLPQERSGFLPPPKDNVYITAMLVSMKRRKPILEKSGRYLCSLGQARAAPEWPGLFCFTQGHRNCGWSSTAPSSRHNCFCQFWDRCKLCLTSPRKSEAAEERRHRSKSKGTRSEQEKQGQRQFERLVVRKTKLRLSISEVKENFVNPKSLQFHKRIL